MDEERRELSITQSNRHPSSGLDGKIHSLFKSLIEHIYSFSQYWRLTASVRALNAFWLLPVGSSEKQTERWVLGVYQGMFWESAPMEGKRRK